MKTGAQIVSELDGAEWGAKQIMIARQNWPMIRAALLAYEPKSALRTILDICEMRCVPTEPPRGCHGVLELCRNLGHCTRGQHGQCDAGELCPSELWQSGRIKMHEIEAARAELDELERK